MSRFHPNVNLSTGICGSVEKDIRLQLYHSRFVAAETLHEGCGGAGLVESGGAGGGGGQADIGGQTSIQVCIFLFFPPESVRLRVKLLVIVVS